MTMAHPLRVRRRRLVLFVLFSITFLSMTFMRGYRSSTAASFRYPSSIAIGATLTQSDLHLPLLLEPRDQHRASNDNKKRLPWEDDSSETYPEGQHPPKDDVSSSYMAPWRLKYQGWARDLTSLDLLEPPRPPMPRQEAFLKEIRVSGSGSLVARSVAQDAKARQEKVVEQ
ncbi:MAG: hypothetical protein BYD32DRAFT_423503 [Podila humilis]|nr:MAG: hypothetical protein BYD32DRAFT_423503 [Podila humilis]